MDANAEVGLATMNSFGLNGYSFAFWPMNSKRAAYERKEDKYSF